ncbi:MAG TPA: PLP-dependent aminotransferase family protein [Blastocatellia bacterium]|nr:PLP-dependent aminotransferase family protein [Blastocatellia bacterium]
MAKRASSVDLTFTPRPSSVALTRWLQDEVRRAILDGRLKPGRRLPATRDFARQYSVSRGTVVTVFEQLASEGYLLAKTGAGTWVNDRLSAPAVTAKRPRATTRKVPAPLLGLTFPYPPRPFRSHEPALAEFPMDVWARVASRRLRRASSALLAGRDIRGYRPLRNAIAEYLGASRGVNCSPDQVVVVSGVQQGLDLITRLLLKPGDTVWMEDPGYFGATTAYRNAGARIVPVPVDQDGICVSVGQQIAPAAKTAYVTPGHQFPLGVTMSLERRIALISWAQQAGAFIIEDDYDSEYRFEERPVPALQGLDKSGSVILLGSFNKLLFPALCLGYIVVPHALIDQVLDLRFGTALHSSDLDQATLSDFIVEGCLGRHLRRMRELYGARLAALLDGSREYLDGVLRVPPVGAGLFTVGILQNGLTSREAEEAAASRDLETMGLDRFTLKRKDVQGLVLGFAAFDQTRIRNSLAVLAAALEIPSRRR